MNPFYCFPQGLEHLLEWRELKGDQILSCSLHLLLFSFSLFSLCFLLSTCLASVTPDPESPSPFFATVPAFVASEYQQQ